MVKTHAQPYKHIIHTNTPNSLSRRTAITRRTHCHAGQENSLLPVTAGDKVYRAVDLADYCMPVSEVPCRQYLRSARCHQLSIPRVRRSSLLGPVHFLSPDQQSEIHCPIICAIQLLTPNN